MRFWQRRLSIGFLRLVHSYRAYIGHRVGVRARARPVGDTSSDLARVLNRLLGEKTSEILEGGSDVEIRSPLQV